MKYKAIIRVVKSITLNYDTGLDTVEVTRESLIEAKDKNEVKLILLEKYPQFFPNGKVYEKETKDNAQFFYVVIYPLMNYELMQVDEGEWVCSFCGQKHENKYISKPKINERLYGKDIMFCRSDDNYCENNYKMEKYEGIDMPDDEVYIRRDSLNYIYKITEKATNKCYIGKTRNAPFFRWWNHLTHSGSPFGSHLRTTKLSEWTFEVLEELPCDASDKYVFEVESKYILQFDSIKNGYNSLISDKKTVVSHNDKMQVKLEFEV